MSRVRFKGGAWTNSEDEVLRAALSVYGLHNWERVASMLVRKTAAQCRERFEAFLDPRLHLREPWAADEEARLVRLQALFPGQWGLIARELASRRGGLNRPPWLCEEHYHTLLDALEFEKQKRQQAREGQERGGETMTLEDFVEERKRQRGARLGHEMKAARPDAADTESFEEEMVQFAVSRLANQDGKKGLRKERKKQLEHTSFLAKLQNNREAIESGTLSARAKKKMERAMLEDQSGPKGVRVQDGVMEDEEKGSDADEDDKNDDEDVGHKRKEKKVFKSIDLAADKEAAGIQAKQRVLVKDLSAQNQKQQNENATAAEGVNVAALLRLAGDPVATARLEDKKKGYSNDKRKKDTTGRVAAGVMPEKSAVDIDSLFAALPDVVAVSPPADRNADSDIPAVMSELFDAPSFPSSTPAQSAPEAMAPAALSPSSSPSRSESLTPPIDFSSPENCAWLREAKRRVLMEAKRTFMHGKRHGADDRSARDVNNKSDDVSNGEIENGGGAIDGDTRRIVEALVANHMTDTAKNLLGGENTSPDAATRKRSRDADISGEFTASLAALVATEPEAANFASGVGASDAIMQLEELLRHQRQQTAGTVGAKRQRAERIVRLCFGGEREGKSECLQRVCARYGAELEKAQRALSFYSALLETERREMRRRTDAASKELADIEATERELQEQYQAMRLKEAQ